MLIIRHDFKDCGHIKLCKRPVESWKVLKDNSGISGKRSRLQESRVTEINVIDCTFPKQQLNPTVLK